METKALVDKLADKPTESKAKTLEDTLGKVEVMTLVDTMAGILA